MLSSTYIWVFLIVSFLLALPPKPSTFMHPLSPYELNYTFSSVSLLSTTLRIVRVKLILQQQYKPFLASDVWSMSISLSLKYCWREIFRRVWQRLYYKEFIFWFCVIRFYRNPDQGADFLRIYKLHVVCIKISKVEHFRGFFFYRTLPPLFFPSKYSVSTVVFFWVPLQRKSLHECVHSGRVVVYFLSALFCSHRFIQTDKRKARSRRPRQWSRNVDTYTDSCIELYKPSEFYFLSYFTTRNILQADKGFIPAHTGMLVPQHPLWVVVPWWSVETQVATTRPQISTFVSTNRVRARDSPNSIRQQCGQLHNA